MKPSYLALFEVAALSAFFNFSASGLTISDPGVVGIVDAEHGFPTDSNPATEFQFAQILLNLAPGQSTDDVAGFEGLQFIASPLPNDYSGNLDASLLTNPANPSLFQKTQFDSDQLEKDGVTHLPVPSLFDYVIVKYDGPNAGWVLFALDDISGGIPVFPYDIWGKNSTQFGISHYTAFNVANVPDGGTTLALLGLAFAGLTAFRWRFAGA